MSQPTPYNPITSFISYQSQQAWFPGQNLDVEFNAIKVSINATEANLALLQKDDGTFADSLVDWQNLTSNFQQQLIDQGFTPPVVTPPSTGLLTGNNTWTGTNTYTPIGTQQAIIVNAPNSQTAAAAVTISKGTGGKSALDIKSPLDNSGRLISIYGPNDIASDTPAQYTTTGGQYSKLFLNISGHSTGAGPSYNISFGTADACMLAVWADVAKGIQVRGNAGGDGFSGGGASLSTVSGDGHYTGSILFDGTIAWGSTTNTTFAGQDTFLVRGNAAALLQLGGPDSGVPVAQRLAAMSVATPISDNSGFLYGTVFHFAAGVPAGVAPGQTITDITNPAFVVTTKVVSVDFVAKTVTSDNYGNPYQGDVFQFNGTNNATLTNQLGSIRIGYGSVKPGVVVGQTVTDNDNPTAIPGGTTISSIDSSLPPGSGGSIFLVLSAAIDGTLFNTHAGGHDTVVFSTVDTAAADWHISGGRGTGAGHGGKVTIDAAPAGSTGSSQNSWVTYVTVDPNPATGTPETQVAKGLKAGFYASAAPNTQIGSTYAVLATDTDIIANRAGTITLTLPSAAAFVGRVIRVKTIQAQTVISDASNVAPMTSATPGTAILGGTAGKWADLKSDGTNWIIMAGN